MTCSVVGYQSFRGATTQKTTWISCTFFLHY